MARTGATRKLCQFALGSVRNVSALGYAALKTGSDAHLQLVNSASSPVLALPNRRSKTFRTEPKSVVLGSEIASPKQGQLSAFILAKLPSDFAPQKRPFSRPKTASF